MAAWRAVHASMQFGRSALVASNIAPLVSKQGVLSPHVSRRLSAMHGFSVTSNANAGQLLIQPDDGGAPLHIGKLIGCVRCSAAGMHAACPSTHPSIHPYWNLA